MEIDENLLMVGVMMVSVGVGLMAQLLYRAKLILHSIRILIEDADDAVTDNTLTELEVRKLLADIRIIMQSVQRPGII
jgi:hypothetical protein